MGRSADQHASRPLVFPTRHIIKNPTVHEAHGLSKKRTCLTCPLSHSLFCSKMSFSPALYNPQWHDAARGPSVGIIPVIQSHLPQSQFSAISSPMDASPYVRHRPSPRGLLKGALQEIPMAACGFSTKRGAPRSPCPFVGASPQQGQAKRRAVWEQSGAGNPPVMGHYEPRWPR